MRTFARRVDRPSIPAPGRGRRGLAAVAGLGLAVTSATVSTLPAGASVGDRGDRGPRDFAVTVLSGRADQVSGGRAYATWEVGQAVCRALADHAHGAGEFAGNPYREAVARG